jgi:RNA polymerase I-specific transcription initiation factor RRN7
MQTVCRDIWALHLSLMPQPPPAEAHFDLEESAPTKGPGDTNAKTSCAERGFQSDGEGEQSDSSGSSASDEEDDEDPELNELMQENSESSSSSEDGGVDRTTKVPLAPPKVQSAKKQFSRYASLSSTIAVLMLACWTIRIPVIYMDFIR